MFGQTISERIASSLEAAHSTQDTLNVFTSIDDEGALERAAALDQRIEDGDDVGPLAGSPVAVKDLIDQANRVTTNGSSFYRETPDSSASCVTAIERDGGVVIGRTGLHEFAFGFSSENPFWGAVRNPWDPTTSPGGSSGGSAAAVAAGIVPLALGTDTGGSVRVPAALCGTYGLKVTYGRIPLDGVFPLVPSIDTVGPLASSIDIIEASYRAMSGDVVPEPTNDRLRFGVPQPWFDDSPIDADVADEFQRAIDTLTSNGHRVDPIGMPDVVASKQIYSAIAEEVREVHRDFRAAGKEYGGDVSERLDMADVVTSSDVLAARKWQHMIRGRFADALAKVDFLITPTVPARRKFIGDDLIGGRPYRSVLSYFSGIVNHSLHPAIALPLAGSGAPAVSLQVIGPLDSEVALIGLGRSLDAVDLTRFTLAPKSSPTPGAG